MKRLIIDLTDKAPVDQLLWSVWGFCVLEDFSDAGLELACSESSVLLTGLESALQDLGGLAVCRSAALEPDPDTEFVLVSSAAVLSRQLLGFASLIHVCPAGAFDSLAPDWFWDAAWLARFRQRAGQVAEKLLDSAGRKAEEQHMDQLRTAPGRVSLISSVFKADRFLPHFLDNCSRLDGYAETEHWLIRPGSPGEEHCALIDHVRRWPGAIYLNLVEDPGLYETWNLACCLARGRYLSNANVDDRRHPQQVRRLAAALDVRPGLDLASAALRVTDIDNQDWDDWSDGRVFYAEDTDGEYGGAELVRTVDGQRRPRNLPHCMPLWRRALHGLRGVFNEAQYGPSADWEYWLRCAEAGSRYYRTPEALGLYLKREDSYWHQDPSARRFDERILSAYPADSDRVINADPPARTLVWRELTRFEQTGNWCGVWLCLMRLAAIPGEDEAAKSRRAVLDAKARRYFGLRTLAKFDPGQFLGGSLDLMAGLLSALIDDVHAFVDSLEPDPARRQSQLRRWLQLLVDWHSLTDDVTALVAVAFLQRHFPDGAEAEPELLRWGHALDPVGFWRVFQRVYRFAVPLQQANALVEALPALPSESAADLSNTRLWYFPAYSNKYQDLLYWQACRQGLQADPVASVDALAALQPAFGAANILHLHWMNAVFQDADVAFDAAAEAFLTLVEDRQRAGFTVYWTVHNRLNHEASHPEQEKAFRTRLARQVDRVYLHHPLLRYQLDWWPEDVQPWLCEHGPYVSPVRGGIDPSLARQRLDIDPAARVFLCFGNMRPYKGLSDWLPGILESLASAPQALLVLAGRCSDPDVRQLAEAHPEQVRLINRHVPNMELQHLANASDFGLLTYRNILTSGAMFHLYCMGLPVIAPDKGSLPAYVVPGWNGFLYRDEKELAGVLRRASGIPDKPLSALRVGAEKTAAVFRWGRVVGTDD